MSTVMNNTYKCTRNIELMEVDGEFLILDANLLTMTKINGIGAKLWTLLQQNIELNQIFTMIQEEYEIIAAELERDISVYLEELHRMGLIEYESA